MDSNLTNSEIEKDLRKRLGIPNSRASQENVYRNANPQQPIGYCGRGVERDHFRRGESSEHARRRPDPATSSHSSPRGQRPWWDQQSPTSGSSPRAHNYSRNAYYSRSPKKWQENVHEFSPDYGPQRDGRVAEHSGSNSYRPRGGFQEKTKDIPLEGKGVSVIDCIGGGGGDVEVQAVVGDKDEDNNDPNKKGAKRRVRKKKKDKKGLSGTDDSFEKLEMTDTENKSSIVIPLVPKQDVEDNVKQDDKLKLNKSVSVEKAADPRTKEVKHVASAQMVKRAIASVAKQSAAAPIIQSELNLTSHESWPELGNEVSIKNNKTALKQKEENEITAPESKGKPVAPNLPEENRPPPEVLERLAKECIFPLKKRHAKFPKAMFFCHLCEYHCDTVPICNRHLKESRHLKNKSIRELEITLRNLPPPTDSHTEVITDLLLNVHQQVALTDEELKVRQQFVKDLNVKVHKKLPCCEIRLYGSSMTGFGMRGADVNIDLVVSDKENPAKTLMTVFEILKTNGDLAKVESDFGAKIPAIHFLEKKTLLKCVVSLNNLTSYKTTCLLTEYEKIDPRVRILAVLFRHWAKLCMIDRQTMGTLPSYSYSLMLVYFLQQHDPPVLPVLHEMVKTPSDEYLSAEEACKQWQTPNKQSVGALWVDLFKFFSVSYKMTDFVISLRQWKPVTRNEKNWSTKKIALEDPYSPKRNLARFISNQILFDYILERFKMTYKYFGIPQTTKGPLFNKLSGVEQECEDHSDVRIDDTGRRFLEVLDSIAKQTKAAKLRKKDASNANKDDDDDVLVLSLSELKKMNELVQSSVSANDRTTDVDSVCISDVASTAADISVTTLKKESKSAKNGKNLATKKDIDGQQQHAKGKNRTDSVRSCESPRSAQKENDILDPFLSTGSQDDGDSEDFSEISPRGADDDSEQENCIPTSLMEALDDDLDVSSLSGAEGSDTLISLVTNQNEAINGDLMEDLQFLEINGNQSQVNDGRRNADGKMVSRPLSKKPEEQGSNDCDKISDSRSDAIPLKAAASVTEVNPSAADSSEKGKDQANSKENHDLSPKTKRVKTAKVPEELLEKINCLQKEDFCFQFKDVTFTGGKVPSVFCGVCQKEGHLKQDCPEEKLPELLPLPHMEYKFMCAIDQACREIYIDNCPRDYETAERLEILRDLQGFIQHHLFKDARLELFGSSCNGFGFAHSDMDICLTFTGNKTGEDLKCVPIIESLTEKLKKHKNLYNVIPITTAKVPIVKFIHRPSRLEGDISLYNTLAQHNTRMLSLYSELDPRVKILGYTMKYFAKCCDIGDASRGSLSSYAYILMVIYFLQQRNPPVVPVLQEMYDKSKPAPTRIVDGWNAWFLEDPKKVQKMWPHFGENQESIGELWLGLLRFYTEDFNFQDSVISIRQLKILTRFEKLWNSKCIAIEDPFDLQHNLGAGVSRKMNSYIMKAFIKGRNIFGTPLRKVPHRYRCLKDYLFCPAELTDGAPPNDRGCRLCGKIGHMVKDCPRKRPQNRDRESAGKDQNKDQSRDNVQAQSNELPKGQLKDLHRDQTREFQRPSREKKNEPFFVEKMLGPRGQGFSLPTSLQFNNSLLASQPSRNVLMPHPLIGMPFNRNGPQIRPGLHSGQFPPNMPMPQQSPQLTALRLTPTQPIVAHNIQQDETTANNHNKASSSMPNLATPCVMTPLLIQPTSKPPSTPLEEVSSSSKNTNNSLVQSSMHHHALLNSGLTTIESPLPMQYSKSDSQVSSTLSNQEKTIEQLHQQPATETNDPKVHSSARSRNVIVAQSLKKLSNPSQPLGQVNAKEFKCKSGFDISEQPLARNTDVASTVAPNPKKLNDSCSALTCAGSAISEKLNDGPVSGSAPPSFIAELMKDRPTIGTPTTVFTAESIKESLAFSNLHSSERVRLMNAQNLRTSSNAGNLNQFSSPQPSADSTPTSFGPQIPIVQHPPAPPGFMNVNYRMQFPQRHFSAEGTAPFTALQEQVPRGRGHPPPPPPGIPVATSFSPVYVTAGENGTGGIPRQSNSAQQFPGNIHPQITQPSQQFTQFPGLFHAYPTQYFPMGLSTFPVSAYNQMPSQQQQQQQHPTQKIPSGHPSPAPSPQLILQDHPTGAPLIARTCAEAIPISTSAQTRPTSTQESSPLSTHHLGNQFPSSHERPSENIVLNAMGIIRPNSNHDNQWLQLNIASSAHSQTLSETSHSTGGSGGPLYHGTSLNFKGNDSD